MSWDLYTQKNIADAARAAESAEAKVERYARAVEDLQRHVDRLSLACQAMWELLKGCSDITEEDLEKKILEVDGRDGSVDGKIGTQVLDCPACGRKTNSRRGTCVMCGALIKPLYPFAG